MSLIERIKKMKKGFFYIILGLVMLNAVFGLSDPINQSLSEFNNLTRADNVLEFTQEINLWVGGLFGITFLVLIFAVSFMLTLFFRNDIGKAMMFSMFITTVTSILLYTVNLVPDEAVFLSVPLFLLSLAFAVINK